MKVWTFILTLLPLLGIGQENLIPNGSFELSDTCDGAKSCSLIEPAVPWFVPTNCTSDLFHSCSDGICTVPYGEIFPFDGEGMAGQFVRGEAGDETREYIAVHLLSPLEQDSLHELTIRLRYGGGNGTAIGSFGAYFSQDSTIDYSLNHHLFELIPQLQRNPDSIMDDPNIWYEWTDTLSASGGENFIMLGNFLNDANTPFHQPSWNPGSYYFIDDVRLTKISKPNSVQDMDLRFGVAPNPAADRMGLTYSGNLRPSKIRLLSIDGRMVHTEQWRSEVDVSGLKNGIYLLQVEFDNGAIGTQRLVIQR